MGESQVSTKPTGKPKSPQLIAFEKSLYEKEICKILSGIAHRELVFRLKLQANPN